jgi:hypothetical protein
VLEKIDVHIFLMIFYPYLTTHTEINSRRIRKQNIKAKTITCLEENISIKMAEGTVS